MDGCRHPEIEVVLSFQELRELTGADPLPEDLSVLRLQTLACQRFLNNAAGIETSSWVHGVTEMPARSSESLQGSTPWMLALQPHFKPPAITFQSVLQLCTAHSFDDRETSTQAAAASMFVHDNDGLVSH